MTDIIWAANVITPWQCLATDGKQHESPAPGCSAFIPLFDTEQQAKEWAGADAEIIPLKIDAREGQ